jgi:trehalose 6-phosphate synthase
MRMTLRFVIPLLVALSAIAYATVSLVDQLVMRWFMRDLDSRSMLISNTIRDELVRRLATGDNNATVRLLTEVSQDEKLFALGVCTEGDQPVLATPSFPHDVNCSQARKLIGEPSGRAVSDLGVLHVAASTIGGTSGENAALVLIHDMSFVKRRSDETRRYFIWRAYTFAR